MGDRTPALRRYELLKPSGTGSGLPTPSPSTGISALRASASSYRSGASGSSSTTNFSAAAAFASLSAPDVQFFDRVVQRVGNGASDFAALKRAYNAVLSEVAGTGAERGSDGEGPLDAGRDAELWDALLKLVRVRGRNWAERWDGVRMSLGLEPRDETNCEQDTSSSALDGFEEGEYSLGCTQNSFRHGDGQWERANMGAPNHRERTALESPHQGVAGRSAEALQARIAALAGQARSLALTAGSSSVAPGMGSEHFSRKRTVRTERTTYHPGHAREGRLVDVDSPPDDEAFTSNPPIPSATPPPYSDVAHHLNTAADSSRAKSYGQAEGPAQRNLPPHVRSVLHSPASLASPAAARDARRVRMQVPERKSEDGLQTRLALLPATSTASKAGEPSGLSQIRQNADRGSAITRSPPEPVQAPAPGTQSAAASRTKRFDEVVRAARAEREAIRQAEAERVEREEEEAWRAAALRADRVWAQGAKRKVWYWWAARYRREELRQTQVHAAYSQIVSARAFDTWRRATTAQVDLRVRAARVDGVRCLLGAWRTWLRVAQQRKDNRRLERREKLKSSYLAVVQNRDKTVIEIAWTTWRAQHMDKVAEQLRRARLLRGAFALWQLLHTRRTALSARANHVMRRTDARIQQEAWDTWQLRVELHTREMTARAEGNIRVLERAWDTWRRASTLSALASAFGRDRLQRTALLLWAQARAERVEYRRQGALADRWRARRTKRVAFAAWGRKLARVDALDVRADTLLAQRNERLVAQSLQIWVVAERGALLVRVRESRAQAAALRQWTQRFRAMTLSLEQRASTVISSTEFQLTQHAFQTWLSQHRAQSSALSLAISRDRRSLQISTFNDWAAAAEQRWVRTRRAEVVADFFAERDAWGAWIAKLNTRRVNRWMEKKAMNDSRGAFEVWRQRAAQTKNERQAVEKLQQRIDARLQQEALVIWINAVIERREREIEAAEGRNRRLLATALMRWTDACARHDDMLNLMQSYRDVKREDLQRRILARWLANMRSARSRRERADHLIETRARDTLRSAWEKWSERYSESVLRPLEYEMLIRRQDLVTESVLDRWKSRTNALPAIHFANARLKSKMFIRWCSALPAARALRKSVNVERQAVLKNAFKTWLQAAKAKQSLRAAARFGGSSMTRLRSLNPRFATPVRFAPSAAAAPTRRAAGSGPGPRIASAGASKADYLPTPTPTPTPTPIRQAQQSFTSESNLSSLLSSPAQAGFGAIEKGTGSRTPARGSGLNAHPHPVSLAQLTAHEFTSLAKVRGGAEGGSLGGTSALVRQLRRGKSESDVASRSEGTADANAHANAASPRDQAAGDTNTNGSRRWAAYKEQGKERESERKRGDVLTPFRRVPGLSRRVGGGAPAAPSSAPSRSFDDGNEDDENDDGAGTARGGSAGGGVGSGGFGGGKGVGRARSEAAIALVHGSQRRDRRRDEALAGDMLQTLRARRRERARPLEQTSGESS